MQVTVELFLDGVLTASTEGDVPNTFATATLLLGQLSGVAPQASSFSYDNARVNRSGENLLGNSGFEDAIIAQSGSSTAPAWGNWRGYSQSGTTVRTSTPPVYEGSYVGRTTVTNRGGYLLQDVDVNAGDVFEIESAVFPDYGTQSMALLFDWDRSEGETSGTARATFLADRIAWGAWGLGGDVDPLPYDTWTHVLLRLTTESRGFVVGQVAIG